MKQTRKNIKRIEIKQSVFFKVKYNYKEIIGNAPNSCKPNRTFLNNISQKPSLKNQIIH